MVQLQSWPSALFRHVGSTLWHGCVRSTRRSVVLPDACFMTAHSRMLLLGASERSKITSPLFARVASACTARYPAARQVKSTHATGRQCINTKRGRGITFQTKLPFVSKYPRSRSFRRLNGSMGSPASFVCNMEHAHHPMITLPQNISRWRRQARPVQYLPTTRK